MLSYFNEYTGFMPKISHCFLQSWLFLTNDNISRLSSLNKNVLISPKSSFANANSNSFKFPFTVNTNTLLELALT